MRLEAVFKKSSTSLAAKETELARLQKAYETKDGYVGALEKKIVEMETELNPAKYDALKAEKKAL